MIGLLCWLWGHLWDTDETAHVECVRCHKRPW